MTQDRQRRSYHRYPGLSKAARDFGVSIGHARRVLIGERTSPTLLKKLHARLGGKPATTEAAK